VSTLARGNALNYPPSLPLATNILTTLSFFFSPNMFDEYNFDDNPSDFSFSPSFYAADGPGGDSELWGGTIPSQIQQGGHQSSAVHWPVMRNPSPLTLVASRPYSFPPLQEGQSSAHLLQPPTQGAAEQYRQQFSYAPSNPIDTVSAFPLGRSKLCDVQRHLSRTSLLLSPPSYK
jgi:hypothetical protein